VAHLERDLLAATEGIAERPELARERASHDGRLRHVLILDEHGRLLYPSAAGVLGVAKRRWIERTRPLWDRGGVAFPPSTEGATTATHGWQEIGWGDGGALFWRRGTGGRRVVVEVSGAALLAALLERLPVTLDHPGGRPVEERVALLDAGGRVAYQWGRYRPPAGATPLLSAPLAPPLEAWRLAYLGPPPPRASGLGIAAGVAALALVLALVGVWTYRESGRALRDAAQRVNFVNQVSHELKTPLTNVRLYAELLEEQLPEEDAVARRRLQVLLGECRRLSRLITNVLTFAREGRRATTAATTSDAVPIDDVVRDLVEQFAPAFQAQGVRVDFEGGAPRPVGVDSDALAQIVGNLFGNVEKYAPCAPLRVRTHQEPGRVRIAVHDGGPGIPVAARERVFEPFVRLEGEGLEAVPGTGIGLGIARDLARAHGGDLRIVPADRGACFEVTLAVKELP
jgi:signal transduction histidine kinase